MEATINKSKELRVSLNLLNEKLHFEGTVAGNKPISIDYVPPFGDNLGYTSLELLLLSLSSCLGSSILLLLKRMQKNITGLSISASGIRSEEHPTGFKSISIEFDLKSTNTTEKDFNKALKLSEEIYCPVWAMVKSNVEITVLTNIISN